MFEEVIWIKDQEESIGFYIYNKFTSTNEKEAKKLKEMFDFVGIDLDLYRCNWYQIITHYVFLRVLFNDHVRLTISGTKCGVPYYYWIENVIHRVGEIIMINFIYNEWKNPKYTKEYTKVIFRN